MEKIKSHFRVSKDFYALYFGFVILMFMAQAAILEAGDGISTLNQLSLLAIGTIAGYMANKALYIALPTVPFKFLETVWRVIKKDA